MPALKLQRIHVVLAVLVFLNSFDAGVTLFLLETRHAWEANPYLAAAYRYGGPCGFLLAKAAVVGVGCLALWRGRDLPTPIPVATAVAGACLLVFLYEVVSLLLLFGGRL